MRARFLLNLLTTSVLTLFAGPASAVLLVDSGEPPPQKCAERPANACVAVLDTAAPFTDEGLQAMFAAQAFSLSGRSRIQEVQLFVDGAGGTGLSVQLTSTIGPGTVAARASFSVEVPVAAPGWAAAMLDLVLDPGDYFLVMTPAGGPADIVLLPLGAPSDIGELSVTVGGSAGGSTYAFADRGFAPASTFFPQDSGSTGVRISGFEIVAVPAPGTLALFWLGIAASGLGRRKAV